MIEFLRKSRAGGKQRQKQTAKRHLGHMHGLYSYLTIALDQIAQWSLLA